MITFFASILISNKENYRDAKVRRQYGTLCGIVGILLNLLLFMSKLIIGRLTSSIAITADAFNNLSDAGSSVVTLAGFRLAGSKPDPDHPFGHGRIEYLSGLAVSAAILIMAYQLIRDSIDKVLHPQEMVFKGISILILAASIGVKCYMAYYNYSIGKKINSAAMKATAKDSFSDMAATFVVLLSMIVYWKWDISIDAWCGVVVGIFIFYTGISAAKETVDPLLGQAPKQEFVDEITEIVLSYPKIMGIHDMVVHDYGPGRQMISLHAEVPAEGKIIEIHDIIDNIEAKLKQKLGIHAVIHMDPVITRDEQMILLKKRVNEILQEVGNELTMHDFRIVPGETHINMIFDLVVPYKYKVDDDQLLRRIQEKIKNEFGDHYFVVIAFDRDFIGISGS